MARRSQQIGVSLARAAALCAALGAGNTLAQDLTSADNGRYNLLHGSIVENGRDVPVVLMIDSQTGRTWRLFPDERWGGHWQRMPLVRMDNAPDGMLTRPLPVAPQGSSAAPR